MKIKNKNLFKISFFISIFFILFYILGLFSNLNTTFTDSLYGGNKPLDNIVLITIDEKSLNEFSKLDITRDEFAKIINKIPKNSTIGIDIGFYSNLNSIKNTNLNNAIKNHQKIILVNQYLEFETIDRFVIGKNLLKPVNFEDNIKQGYSNILIDKDRISRAINFDIKGNYNSFAQEIYLTHFDKEFIYPKNRFYINYIGPPGTFKTYSFDDVLNNKIESKNF